MKLMLIVSARPQIIKSAPIIHDAMRRSEIEFQLVHTGQHYDFEMSKIFFGELDLPEPIVNLGIGSGTHAFQTSRKMIEIEKAIANLKPDMVMVPGDTNSTLAAALAAVEKIMKARKVKAKLKKLENPFGDGHASRKILDFILKRG